MEISRADIFFLVIYGHFSDELNDHSKILQVSAFLEIAISLETGVVLTFLASNIEFTKPICSRLITDVCLYRNVDSWSPSYICRTFAQPLVSFQYHSWIVSFQQKSIHFIHSPECTMRLNASNSIIKLVNKLLLSRWSLPAKRLYKWRERERERERDFAPRTHAESEENKYK